MKPTAEPLHSAGQAPQQHDVASSDSLLQQKHAEHRSLLRGLLLLALLVLAVSIARAGWHRAFVSGWWRQW